MRTRVRKPLWMLSLIVAWVYGTGVTNAQSSQPSGGALEVRVSQNAAIVPMYEVLELSFLHENSYANPFFDATIDMTFTSPGGKIIPVGGFFYGSDEKPRIQPLANAKEGRAHEYVFARHNLWKARFAPSELGQWTYTYRFTNVQGQQASGTDPLEKLSFPAK